MAPQVGDLAVRLGAQVGRVIACGVGARQDGFGGGEGEEAEHGQSSEHGG